QGGKDRMHFFTTSKLLLALTALLVIAGLGMFIAQPLHTKAAGNPKTYIVTYTGSVDKGAVQAHGDTILADLSAAGVLVVSSSDSAGLAALPGVYGIAEDNVTLSVPDETEQATPASGGASCASTTASCGLQWDLARIHVPAAWKVTQGSASVKVAVLDT